MKIRESAVHAFNFLARRANAYKNIFATPTRAWKWQRRQAYRDLFAGPVGAIVLQDLMKFCRANETCFDLDPRIHAALEGRREIWNRIQNHLQLSPEELWKLYNPSTPLTGE
jgi:hypothetical protein